MVDEPLETEPESVVDADAPEDDGLDMAGFEEAVAQGLPGQITPGEAPPTDVVDTDEVEETPASENTETPADEQPEPEDKPDDEEPATEKPVNFDGFSDAQKATFQRLLDDGHVTPEEVEESRKNSLFMASWTRRHMAQAEKEKAWEAEQAKVKEDLETLEWIRENDARHQAFLRLSSVKSGEADLGDEDEDAESLVDKRSAEQIALDTYKKLEAEKNARTQKEQAAYEAKKEDLLDGAKELMKIHGIDVETMDSYITAEVATLPPGTDPILAVDRLDMQRRIMARHAESSKDARIAALEAELGKRKSKAARTSKQSMPPAPSVTNNGAPKDALAQMEEDLGLPPDWDRSGIVTGFGFPQKR